MGKDNNGKKSEKLRNGNWWVYLWLMEQHRSSSCSSEEFFFVFVGFEWRERESADGACGRWSIVHLVAHLRNLLSPQAATPPTPLLLCSSSSRHSTKFILALLTQCSAQVAPFLLLVLFLTFILYHKRAVDTTIAILTGPSLIQMWFAPHKTSQILAFTECSSSCSPLLVVSRASRLMRLPLDLLGLPIHQSRIHRRLSDCRPAGFRWKSPLSNNLLKYTGGGQQPALCCVVLWHHSGIFSTPNAPNPPGGGSRAGERGGRGEKGAKKGKNWKKG